MPKHFLGAGELSPGACKHDDMGGGKPIVRKDDRVAGVNNYAGENGNKTTPIDYSWPGPGGRGLQKGMKSH